MVDPSTLIDEIVATLQSNAALLLLLALDASGDPNPQSIYPYYQDGSSSEQSNADSGTNFEMAIQQQPEGSIMVAWAGTLTGNFAKNEATIHNMICYIRPLGKASTIMATMIDGQCTVPYAGKFRFMTIDPKCHPPAGTKSVPRTALIGEGYIGYDYVPVEFAMIEKGVDN